MSSSVENNGRLHEETTEDAPLNFTEIRNEAPRKGEHFGGDGEVPGLETPLERRMRRKSHYIIYFTTFIMSIGFSIILTGVWPYLKQLDPTASKEFLGWVVAANPLGQMLFSPVLGWWANRSDSNRSAFLLTITLSIVGNVMYALLPIMKDSARYLILISRFIVGLSGANVAICRSYIVASTKLKERTAALSATSAAQAIGFILGPSLQTGLIFSLANNVVVPDKNGTANFTLTEPLVDEQELSLFNVYALAGYVAAFLSAVNLILFFPCLFQEVYLADKEVRMTSRENSHLTYKLKPDYVAIAVLLFEIFMLVLVFVLIETLIVPLCMDIYGWTPSFAVKVVGIALTIAGVFSTVAFGLSGYLSKKFDERKVYIFLGLIPMILSMALFFPVGNTYPKIKYCNSTSSDGTDLVLNNNVWLNATNYANSSAAISVPSKHSGASFVHCDELGCPASQKWCFTTPVIVLPQLIIACAFCTLGYPMSLALSNGIFSKMLGFRPQGFWMGILSSVMSFSRVVGPIFVTYVYTFYGMRWTFGSLSIIMLFVLFTALCFFKRFVALQFVHEDKEVEDILTNHLTNKP